MSWRALALASVVLFTFVVGVPTRAFAEERGSTFVVVVTSNRSPRLARPDLRYADDDGAKYFELFRMLAPEENVALLTTFDSDSEKLFPDLVGKARPPTTANLRAAVASLAAKARAAAASGPVDFYFVFAGHGDVDRGKGFLELEDAPFTADDLEALLRAMPASRSHVILDSCNAFFAIQARRPGGRHFVTSEEATRSLAQRLPGVGVFLSTSAEGNVYEWSSIQAGIFSHAVRSGLAGAADVDGNGRVSYDELRAFVEVATREIKNPAYRPQLFARGPGGQGGANLVDLRRARGRRLRIDETRQRLTVRDPADVPWFDLHKEEGIAVNLVLPERVAAGGAIERLDGTTVGRRALLAMAGEETELAALGESPRTGDARGADEVFRSMFALPFGPRSYAESAARPSAAAFVLGVSPSERQRLALLLQEAADSARRRRSLLGGTNLVLGAGYGITGGLALERGFRKDDVSIGLVGGVFALAGGVFVVRSVLEMAKPSFEERTFDSFSRGLVLAPDTARAQQRYAEGERRLLAAAAHDRDERTWNRWLGLASFALYGGLATGAIVDADGDLSRVSWAPTATFAGVALFGAALAVDSFFPTTTERMARLWTADPDRARLSPTSTFRIRPTGAGFAGTF